MNAWVLLATASALGWAFVVLLDKFVVDTEIDSSRATSGIHTIFNCLTVSALSIYLGGLVFSWYAVGAGVLLGGLYVLANLFWFSGVGSEDVSRFAPVLSFDIVFIALLSSIFLQESFSPVVYGGMALTVIGSFLISLENPMESLFHVESKWGLIIALLTAFIYAVREVIFKHVSTGVDIWTLLLYFSLSGIFFSSFLVYSSRDEIMDNLEGFELLTLSGLVSGFAQVSFFLAISLGSVSLVSTITKTRFLVIFFGATMISRLHPEIIHEPLEARVLLQKLVATAMIITGVLAATLL